MNANILKAKQKLDLGEVIGMPTETVYGLAARIDLPFAIEKIFTTKERPFFDPLIVHVSSVDQAKSLTVQWSPTAAALAARFWPGPLTMVLPKSPHVSDMITSGLESVGVRMPSHPMALSLIQEVGVPLAAPSANKFGRTSPTSAEHVRSEFKNEDVFVLDGGECQVGIESTVLMVKTIGGVHQISILRKGHILRSEIEAALQEAQCSFEYVENVSKKESPGHMKHHYMPKIPMVVLKTQIDLSENEIARQAMAALQSMPDVVEDVKITKPTTGIRKLIELELPSDAVLASRLLYSKLRDCGESGADLIFVRLKSEMFIGSAAERWEGLFDRLMKAASLIL